MRDFATDAFDANPRPFVGLPGPWIEPEYLNETGLFDTAKRLETGTRLGPLSMRISELLMSIHVSGH